ncbi:MAG: carbonic anhydrase [Taibaiella sp.]|nr:carbonic anhydrase [Taibaiella sp.]
MAGIHKIQNIPQDITPAGAIQLLKDGNYRFVNNLKLNRDLLEQVNATKDGQWPFAAILSCMDSRTSAELIFDLGLGDIFSIRIAGNVTSENVLGSLEFATAVAGSKLIVVLGHTNCGAIKGACDNVELGNLSKLLKHIKPAVEQETNTKENRTGKNVEFVNEVAKLNVHHTVKEIIAGSEIIADLLKKGTIDMVPAMYDIATGEVSFYDSVNGVKAQQLGEAIAVN